MKKLISAIIALTASIFTTHAAVAALQPDTLCLQGSVGKLFAVIDRPSESPQPLPLVIIAHGFNDSGLGAFPSSISQSIVRQGMATLRFDFNAHGRSEGEFKNMTVLNEIADLKSVIAWAQQQPWVKDIALVGHSQGGVVVSMTAGELGYPTIKAEVLLAPAAVLRDDALRGNTMGAFYDPWNFQDEYVELPHFPGSRALQLGKNYIESAIKLPIYETAAQYDGPALIVHGMQDRVVPYTYAERYHEKLKNSRLQLIPTDNHMFTETTQSTPTLVAEWLKSTLSE